MLQLEFEYGQGAMPAELPDDTDVFIPGITVPDPPCIPEDQLEEKTRESILHPMGMEPLSKLAHKGSKVTIIFPDRVKGGEQQEMLSSGVTFRESPKNTALWNRWFRFLLLDQWTVFFLGAIIGMMVPSILVGYIASMPGAGESTIANMPVYLASELGRNFGPLLFYFALFVGALTLFKTQSTVLEMLIRNATDAAYTMSGRFREYLGGDPRKFYYPFAVFLMIVISGLIHLALPTKLLLIAANMANFAAMIFPFVIIYLNRQLPVPARLSWWGYVLMVLNVLFFGFFFVNFLAVQLTGTPLVRF